MGEGEGEGEGIRAVLVSGFRRDPAWGTGPWDGAASAMLAFDLAFRFADVVGRVSKVALERPVTPGRSSRVQRGQSCKTPFQNSKFKSHS